MLFTDLPEVKRVLEIDPGDSSENIRLGFFIEQASQWINDYLNRPDISLKQRTQIYQGTGTQKLLLRCRPVFTTPTIQVVVDESAFFGSANGAFVSDPTIQQMTYGVDFALQVDQDDGSSRSGILWRINDLWPRPMVRQAGLLSPFVGDDTGSIQVTYTAGYSVDALPATLRFAANQMVARMRYIFPLGMEISQESYEDRAIGLAAERKDYLMALAKPWLVQYRNWKW